MKVKLISMTQPAPGEFPVAENPAEALMAYCARVSSPNQDNPEYSKLLSYCARHGHWSVFEMADMTVEITTSRAIAQQILRHRSFSFQEFSQRYAEATEFEIYPARRQDKKNRQNSIDDMAEEDRQWFEDTQRAINFNSRSHYEDALFRGIAKEQARFLLPLSTQTKLYMKGSIRSWIHYIQVRTDPSTQLEHREIALECKRILLEQFPVLKEVLEDEGI